MKINGVKVKGAYEEVIVFPRQTGNLVFKARAIADYSAFEKLCPTPVPPTRRYPGGREVKDVEDPKFNEALDKWANDKTDWMVLESLKVTPGLEWETVDVSDSETWGNYKDELKEAGLSPAEQGRLIECVGSANGLDQSKIDEATESFLVAQAAAANPESFLGSEQPATPSGEPASDSTSDQS